MESADLHGEVPRLRCASLGMPTLRRVVTSEWSKEERERRERERVSEGERWNAACKVDNFYLARVARGPTLKNHNGREEGWTHAKFLAER